MRRILFLEDEPTIREVLAEYMKTVSYTHLDVYKRQALKQLD